MTKHYYIGIDEVGRGPLAGPVAVGAVFASTEKIAEFSAIKESKQLSEKKREMWNAKILAGCDENLRTHVAFVLAGRIDEVGIAPAIKEALIEAITALGANPGEVRVLLDGGLKAPSEYVDQETIIKGDANETVIAMASVVAKVARDHVMNELDMQCPGYGLAKHKGYGTAAHIAAIKEKGLSPMHRKSFCGNIK